MWKLGLVIVVLGVVVAVAFLGRARPSSSAQGPVLNGDPIAKAPKSAVKPLLTPGPEKAAIAQPPSPKPQPKTLRVPPEFADFENWTSERQLNAVTDIQRNTHVSPAMRDFLVDLASDPSRRSVLRNNAANALGIQDPPVPGWLGALADQALDPAETPTWRDYALQHLADQLVPRGEATSTSGDFIGSSDSGLDRKRYISALTSVATSKLTVAGTALLHLDRLSREHSVSVDHVQLHALILRVLQGEDVDVGAKVTAFGILGMRGDPADAAIPRQYLKNGDADVRRSAVAALGLLGTDEDIAVIEAVDVGGDPSVEMAKKAACKRLSERRASPAK